jgi:maltooligosyltrehalose trehalohydrolase
MTSLPSFGATWRPDLGTTFHVWAPRAAAVAVVLDDGDRVEPMGPDPTGGTWTTSLADVEPGARYRFRLASPEGVPVDRADPASRWQPDGVHGPSAVDDPRFPWTDAGFAAPPLHHQVLYELHVGTFSPEGTFDGAVALLPELVELGVTTLELLPVWQFPGDRNWGYDGVLPSAVQAGYGGPAGLRRLVDAAPQHGLAVVLDVVYNHIGPEGNHLDDFGPYFTDGHVTPWGPGLNTDGPGSDAVRRWVLESAVGYVRDFHLDGFRLDAVHGIVDQSATHLLEALATAVHAEGARLGKPVHVVAESDLADARLLRSPDAGGYGLDGQWSDEFHHAVHVALTGERDGYYLDHPGLGDIARMTRDRYAYAGRYSRHRERTIGRPAPDVPYDRFVVCVQNHDQVGNRMLGERLTALTDLEGCKLAAATLLTAPFVPMLFMGEEHGETAPFQYFVSHTDPDLVEAVRTGRREEFAAFAWRGEAPDPQDPATFERSKVDHGLKRASGAHGTLHALYRHLIALRRRRPLLSDPTAPDVVATLVPGRQTLLLARSRGGRGHLVLINAEDTPATVATDAGGLAWSVALDTADERWAGPGAADGPHVADDVLTLTAAPRSVRLLDGKAPR